MLSTFGEKIGMLTFILVYDLDRFHKTSYTKVSIWAPCKTPKARVKFPGRLMENICFHSLSRVVIQITVYGTVVRSIWYDRAQQCGQALTAD